MARPDKHGSDPSADYAQVAAQFDVSDIEALLGGKLDTGINACVKCCDRHAVTDAIAVLTMSVRPSPGEDIHEVNVTYFAHRLYKESIAVRPVLPCRCYAMGKR